MSSIFSRRISSFQNDFQQQFFLVISYRHFNICKNRRISAKSRNPHKIAKFTQNREIRAATSYYLRSILLLKTIVWGIRVRGFHMRGQIIAIYCTFFFKTINSIHIVLVKELHVYDIIISKISKIFFDGTDLLLSEVKSGIFSVK
jgi:hypothetical protein